MTYYYYYYTILFKNISDSINQDIAERQFIAKMCTVLDWDKRKKGIIDLDDLEVCLDGMKIDILSELVYKALFNCSDFEVMILAEDNFSVYNRRVIYAWKTGYLIQDFSWDALEAEAIRKKELMEASRILREETGNGKR